MTAATTAPRALLAATAVLAAAGLTGCGHHGPTAAEQDLGPVNTKVLGGTGDSRYLQVFSAAIDTSKAQRRFSATMLYVGTGTDTLVGVTTPFGDATLHQQLQDDSAVPINVPLHAAASSTAPPATVGSTVTVSVRLAAHGELAFAVPIVSAATTTGS